MWILFGMPQNTFPDKIIVCIFADLSIFKVWDVHPSSDIKYPQCYFTKVQFLSITGRFSCCSFKGDENHCVWLADSAVHPTLTHTLPAAFLEISLPGRRVGYGASVWHKGWLLPFIRTRWSWWVGYSPLICPPSADLYLLWNFMLTSSESFIRSWGSAAQRISLYCLTHGQACLKVLFFCKKWLLAAEFLWKITPRIHLYVARNHGAVTPEPTWQLR